MVKYLGAAVRQPEQPALIGKTGRGQAESTGLLILLVQTRLSARS